MPIISSPSTPNLSTPGTTVAVDNFGDFTVTAQGVNSGRIRVNEADDATLFVYMDSSSGLVTSPTSGVTVTRASDGATIHQLASNSLGFFATAAVTKRTGVAVTAAGIHAALVAYGLIAA